MSGLARVEPIDRTAGGASPVARRPAPRPGGVSTRWKPGQSGNPGGRPRVIAEVRDLARERTAAVIVALTEIALDRRQPAAARVAASHELLNRGWGRPWVAVEPPPESPRRDMQAVLRRLSDADLARVNEALDEANAILRKYEVPGDGEGEAPTARNSW
jgi:hypothetical protein